MNAEVEGGFWLLLGFLSAFISGFFFWILVSKGSNVDVIGNASALISAAGLSSLLFTAGTAIAVIREVSLKGSSFLPSILILGTILSILSSVAALILVEGIQKVPVSTSIILLASTWVASYLFLQVLIGLKEFKTYFIVVFIASLIKVLGGVFVAVKGGTENAILWGYLSFFLIVLISAPIILIKKIFTQTRINTQKFFRGAHLKHDIHTLTRTSLANYPFLFSNDFINYASVYLSSLFINTPGYTGILYISLMLMAALYSIPYSFLTAALSWGFSDAETASINSALRVGLAFLIPVSVGIGFNIEKVLSILNPELVAGEVIFKLLILSLPFLTILTASIMKLNIAEDLRGVALLGASRFLVLTLLTITLARNLGSIGICIAYLISTLIPLALASQNLPISTKVWGMSLVHTGFIILALLLNFDSVLTGFVAVIGSLVLLHILKLFRIQEYIMFLQRMIKP